MESFIKSPKMVLLGDKGGASPGALMRDGNKDYIVKLGIPRSHGSYKFNDYNDVDIFIQEMSRRACDEKIFFNIAQAVGENQYILPETDIVFMRPNEYSESSCSVNKRLATKFDVSDIKNASFEDSAYENVIDKINSTEIAHFRSKIITSYQDIGVFYKYHMQEDSIDMRNDEYATILPSEPRGMGAFFALNNFMGNYDCIGASGGNVGFDTASNKLIIVDGGESRTTHKINKIMTSSLNSKTWLSYDDLSDEGRKEASETFARIVNLDDAEIRSLVTNNEQFINSSVFTEEEIARKIGEFKQKQFNIVEVYYDSMVQDGCHMTSKIIALKEEVDVYLAEKQRQIIIENERSATIKEQQQNLLGKRKEDDPSKSSKISGRHIKLKIDPDSESIIASIGQDLRNSGFSSTPKNMQISPISPTAKENTPERLNYGDGKSQRGRGLR